MRRRADSNRCRGFCRPLPSPSATSPGEAEDTASERRRSQSLLKSGRSTTGSSGRRPRPVTPTKRCHAELVSASKAQRNLPPTASASLQKGGVGQCTLDRMRTLNAIAFEAGVRARLLLGADQLWCATLLLARPTGLLWRCAPLSVARVARSCRTFRRFDLKRIHRRPSRATPACSSMYARQDSNL